MQLRLCVEKVKLQHTNVRTGTLACMCVIIICIFILKDLEYTLVHIMLCSETLVLLICTYNARRHVCTYISQTNHHSTPFEKWKMGGGGGGGLNDLYYYKIRIL